MKRKLLAILGLAVVPAAFGQGHILISNYVVSPYNQVYWGDVHCPLEIRRSRLVRALCSRGIGFAVSFPAGKAIQCQRKMSSL
jgi:hypothetical protein